jgi:hypothetical protein
MKWSSFLFSIITLIKWRRISWKENKNYGENEKIGLNKEFCFGKVQTGNFLDPDWDLRVEDMYRRVRLFERETKIELSRNKFHT